MLAQDGLGSSCPKCHASALWLSPSIASLTLIITTCSCCGWNGYERQASPPERPAEPERTLPPLARASRSKRGRAYRNGRTPKCHPEEKIFARGLCVRCYFRWYKTLA